jgi:hypothetical protein
MPAEPVIVSPSSPFFRRMQKPAPRPVMGPSPIGPVPSPRGISFASYAPGRIIAGRSPRSGVAIVFWLRDDSPAA